MSPKSETKTICHLSTVHSGLDARIKERECVTLAGAGYDVHLFIRHPAPELYKDVRIHPLAVPAGRWRRFRYGKEAVNEVMRQRPEVIHFHDPELIPAMLRLKRQEDVKVVFDCHEDVVSHLLLKEYVPKAVRPLLRMLVQFYLRQAARQFDAVITADPDVNQIFSRWNARTATLFNFPPRAIYLEPPEWDFDRRLYDFIYPGSTPRYHLRTMFEIASELKRRGRASKWLILANLQFADAPRWVEANLKERKLRGYFDFAKPVALTDLPPFLRMARIGIIPLPDTPKFHHNIPSKLFDYFLAGLPVILSDLPPSRRFIARHKVAIAVKPGDIRAYADAAEALLANPQRLVNLGRNARSLALSRYTWESQAPKLLEIYSRLLPQRAQVAECRN